MHLAPPIVLAAVLAGIGIYGVLARRTRCWCSSASS
jgi:NADH:ubiquinone oxidoreductase subunit K